MARESFHIWTRITSYAMAAAVAEMLETITGDPCEVEESGPCRFRVLRYTPEGKTVIA